MTLFTPFPATEVHKRKPIGISRLKTQKTVHKHNPVNTEQGRVHCEQGWVYR